MSLSPNSRHWPKELAKIITFKKNIGTAAYGSDAIVKMEFSPSCGMEITLLQFDAPLQDFLRMEGGIVTFTEILGQASLLRGEGRVVFQLQVVGEPNVNR